MRRCGDHSSHIAQIPKWYKSTSLWASGLCSKWAVLPHLLLWPLCVPFCCWALLSLSVVLFYRGSLDVCSNRQKEEQNCAAGLPLSDTHLAPFPCTTQQICLHTREGHWAILITQGWALSVCPLCTARCRGIALGLISTKAMSAVTWLLFILHLTAQITKNTLHFQNENFSRALINIQQGVPEEYRVQCSQSHKTLIGYTWTETSGVAFGYFHTQRHTQTFIWMCVYVSMCICTKTSVIWLVLETVADFRE